MIVVPYMAETLLILIVKVEHLLLAVLLHRFDHLFYSARALRPVDVPQDNFACAQPAIYR